MDSSGKKSGSRGTNTYTPERRLSLRNRKSTSYVEPFVFSDEEVDKNKGSAKKGKKSIKGTPKSTRKSTKGKPEGNLKEDYSSGDEFKENVRGSRRTPSKTPNKTPTTISIRSSGKRRYQKTIVEEDSDGSVEVLGDNNDLVDATCIKPSGLYDEDDVAGNDMYSFPTPKKKYAMQQKAVESASKTKLTPNKIGTPTRQALTPNRKAVSQRKSLSVKKTPVVKQTPKKTCGTPRQESEKDEVVLPKTPYQLRARTKKAIQAHKRTLQAEIEDSDYESSEHSWSDEGSEQEASVSEGSHSSSDDSSDSDSGKGSENTDHSCRRSLSFIQPTTPSRRRGKDVNYVFTADDFFESQSSKHKTSDHRLSKLKTPRLDRATLQKLLKDCVVSRAHQQILAKDDTRMFQRWMFALSQGYSVLAYGLGSKFRILQRFQQALLADSLVLVVNGFFPSLNIKEVVEMLAKDLLGLRQTLPSANAIVDWIESRRWTPRVFLIIHNLEAEVLRGEKTQRILSRLASLPRVHLVASVDHINCPLLWDQAKLSNYNFMWEDVTSFLPYQEETSYETSLLVHNGGSLALSSLLSVYRSLTHNSRGVFRIILDKHLDENSPKFTGMAFSTLYGRCREEMLVTSDLALRTMLTEFLDHEMVKWRRDGEHLYIPTDLVVLRQFHAAIQRDRL